MADDLPLFAPLPPSSRSLTATPGPGVLGTIGDVGLEGLAGVIDVPGKVAGFLGNTFDNPTLRGAAELTSYVSQVVRENQSEAGKAAREASWIGETGKPSAWKTPIRSTAMQLAGVAPQLVGTALAPEAAPLIWGADAAAQLPYETIKEVGALSDKELRQHYPGYREARERNVSEEEARGELIRTRAGLMPSLVAGSTGALGGVAYGRAFAPAMAPWRRRVGGHAAEGAVGGGVGGGGAETARQMGEVAAGGQSDYDIEAIGAATANAGVMGTVIGGVAGGFSKQRRPRGSAVSPEHEAALGADFGPMMEELPGGARRGRPLPPRTPPYGTPPRDGRPAPRSSLVEPGAETWRGVAPSPGAGLAAPSPGTPPRDGRAAPRSSLVEPGDETWNFVRDPYAPSVDTMMPDDTGSHQLREMGIGDLTLNPTVDPIRPGKRQPIGRGTMYPGSNTGGGGAPPPPAGGPPAGPAGGGAPPPVPTPGTPPAPAAAPPLGPLPAMPVGGPTSPVPTPGSNQPAGPLGPLPTVPTRGPASPVPGVASSTTGEGLAVMTVNGRHAPVQVLPEPAQMREDGPYRLVEGPGGTARQWVRAEQLEMLPDWVTDGDTLERWLANRPPAEPRAEPPGTRVFGEPEQRAEGAMEYSGEYGAAPTAAIEERNTAAIARRNRAAVVEPEGGPAKSLRETELEKEIADLEAAIAVESARTDDERSYRIPSSGKDVAAAPGGFVNEERTRRGEPTLHPRTLTLEKGQHAGLMHQTKGQALATMRQLLDGLHAERADLAQKRTLQGELAGSQIPPVAETRKPVEGQPPPRSGFADVGEQVNPTLRAAHLQVGDRVRGPEGDTLVITKIEPGTDPVLHFRWEGDARGAQPGKIRTSVMARTMEAHDYVDPATGERRHVPDATVIPKRDRSMPPHRVRVFGAKEKAVRDRAADLRQLQGEDQPPLRPGPAVPGGISRTSEQLYIRERGVPERKGFSMKKAEQAKRVAQELRKRNMTYAEAKRIATAEVLRDPLIGKRERAGEIERLTRDFMASDIDLARLNKPQPDAPRRGESEAARRERLNIKTESLPPRPGSPEDIARQRESAARPARAGELAGRDAVPVKRHEAEGPQRPVMVHETVDVAQRKEQQLDRLSRNLKASSEAREAADIARRRGSERERQTSMVDSAEAAIRKVFRQGRDIMKSFSQTKFWDAIAPSVTDIKVPKRVRGGKAARAADLEAKRVLQAEERKGLEGQRKDARDQLMSDAKRIIEALQVTLGPRDFRRFVMTRKARRTAEERAAGVVTAYPSRYVARALYRLVTAETTLRDTNKVKKTGMSEAKFDTIMNQHFRDFRRTFDEMNIPQDKAIDTTGMTREQKLAAQIKMLEMTPEERAKAEAEMTPAQRALDAETRADLDDDGVALPASKELVALNNAIDQLEQQVKLRENAFVAANAMVRKAERELKNLLGRDSSRLASKFAQESDEVVAARKALDDAQTKALDEGGKLDDALDKLEKRKRVRDTYAAGGIEKEAGATAGETAEEAAGRDVEVTATKRQSRVGAIVHPPSKPRAIMGEALKKRQAELLKQEQARRLTKIQKQESAEGTTPLPSEADLVERYGEPGTTVESTASTEIDRAVSDIRSHADAADTPAERAKAHATVNLLEAIVRKFQSFIGNAPVRIVDNAEMHERFGGKPKGVFQSSREGALAGGERGIVWLGRDEMTGADGPYTVLHETAHVATDHAIEANPGIGRDLSDLGRHLQAFLDGNPLLARRYGLTAQDAQEVRTLHDPHELLAVSKSNERLQRAMIEIAAPLRIRAKYGLAKDATMWDGFINAVARLFDLKRAEYSALDAMMSISEELSAYVPPRSAHTVADSVAASDLLRKTGNNTPGSNFRALMGVDTDTLKKSLTDRSLNTGKAVGAAYRALATSRSLGETARRYFSAIPDDPRGRNHYDMALERLSRMSTQAETIYEEEFLPVARKAAALAAKYGKGEKWDEWQQYHVDKTMLQIDGSKTLAEQTKRLKSPGGPAPDNAGRHLSANPDAAADVQKRANYADIRARWKALPKDLQEFDAEATKLYGDDNRKMARELMRNLIDITRDEGAPRMADGPAYALVERMLDDTMTPAEAKLYDRGSLFKTALRDSRALAKVGGPWSPLSRFGEHVVRGTYKIDTMGGQRFNSDGAADPKGQYIRFDTPARRKAFDIANKEHKTSQHQTLYFDKTTGERIRGPDGKKAFDAGTATAKYQLHIQDKLVEFHERYSDAVDSMVELRRQIAEEGLGLDLKGIEPRRWEPEEAARSYLDQPYQRAMEELKRSPGWKDMDARQRTALLNTVQELGLRAMGTTRVQSKRIKRRYVAGASTDFMTTFGNYGISSANYRSHLTHMRHINEHLSALKKEVDSTPDFKDEFTYPRQGLLDELRKRTDVRDRLGRSQLGAAVHNGVSRLLQLTSAAKLGSPAYHITNLLEPDMVAGPILDGKFGTGASHRAFRAAERAIGAKDTLGSGLAETGQALIPGNFRHKDFSKPIIERVKSETDGAELASLLGEAVERGGMQRSAGLEFYQTLMPSENFAGRTIDYFDNVSRQMSLASEAVNRAKVLIASYRLARESGMTVEQAKHYALDTNIKSMGDYSTWNMAPAFRHELVRFAAQFKKYGMKTYEIMGHQIADILAAKTWEERKQLSKAFGHILLRHAIMAGSVGLPLEPIRLALIVAGIAGLGYSYEDFQGDIRSTASDLLGKDAGQIISGGLPRYFGLDFSTRMNLDQLVSPFDPKSTKPDDTMQYLATILFGASGDQIKGYLRGVRALSEGKIGDFVEQMAPLKPVHDVTVAIQNIMTEGDLTPSGKQRGTPPDFWDTLTTAAGFRSTRVAEEGDYRNRLLREKAKRHNDRITITQDYVNASDNAGRESAWAKAMRYNADKPAQERITRGTLEKSRASRTKAGRQDEFGVSIGRSEQSLRDLRQYYNVGP